MKEKMDIKNIIRVAETNLDGTKPIRIALRKIKGISFMMSNAIAKKFGDPNKKLGELNDEEIKKLESIITEPQKYGLPSWLFNRRREPKTGENIHLVASSLQFAHEMDINELKRKKCYRGIRHILGLPVRGQRTRSSFRKGKTIGVSRKSKK